MTTEIAASPCLLYSGITESDGMQLMFVYRSPLVEPYDELMKPVYDFLTARCFEEIGTVTEEDERMMFGEAAHTIYRIFEECPGVPHNCRIDRIC